MKGMLPVLLAQLLLFGLGDDIGCAVDERTAAAAVQQDAVSTPGGGLGFRV